MKYIFRFRGKTGYDMKHINLFRGSIVNSIYSGTERIFLKTQEPGDNYGKH